MYVWGFNNVVVIRAHVGSSAPGFKQITYNGLNLKLTSQSTDHASNDK